MSEPTRLIRFCQQETGILTSILEWFHEERQEVLERLAKAEAEEVQRLQGEARKLHELHGKLAMMVRKKNPSVDK